MQNPDKADEAEEGGGVVEPPPPTREKTMVGRRVADPRFRPYPHHLAQQLANYWL
jgi:hypothetical protein